ncbi:MAG: hypothetical protein P1U40_02320 [Coxiellaceae bacterium]|nr:hypothetical protein [Coxiellaceae bacterium]
MPNLLKLHPVKIALASLAILGFSSGYANCVNPVKLWKQVFPQCLNSAWTYDTTFMPVTPSILNTVSFSDSDASPSIVGYNKKATVGSQAQNVITFNKLMGAGKGLNQLYVYGGDAELFCSEKTPCTDSNSKAFSFNYTTVPANAPAGMQGYTGQKNFNAYQSAFAAGSAKDKNIALTVVVDGRINALGVTASWLDNFTYGVKHGGKIWRNDIGQNSTSFNDLSQAQAYAFADKITAQVCTGSPTATGIHFDLEPFNIKYEANVENPPTNSNTGYGQYWFYSRVADNLAGIPHTSSSHSTSSTSTNFVPCHGMYFSVFTFPGAFNPNMSKILNKNKNGYAVVSLYDLGGESTGSINSLRAGLVASTPAYYAAKLKTLLSDLKTAQGKLKEPIYYQIGIPASASAHEFSGYINLSKGCAATAGNSCTPGQDLRLGEVFTRSNGETVTTSLTNPFNQQTYDYLIHIPYLADTTDVYKGDGSITSKSSPTIVKGLYTKKGALIDQAIYVQKALSPFEAGGDFAKDPHWIGTSVWTFSEQNVWVPRYNPTAGEIKGVDTVSCITNTTVTPSVNQPRLIQFVDPITQKNQSMVSNMNSYGNANKAPDEVIYNYCSDVVIGGPAEKVGRRVYFPGTINLKGSHGSVMEALKDSSVLTLPPTSSTTKLQK